MQVRNHAPKLARALTVLALSLTVWLIAVPTPRASAHPLGNFSVNRYSRLTVTPRQVELVYVLDMAEIPTFQLRADIDRDGDGILSSAESDAFAESEATLILSNLTFSLNGRPAQLAPDQTTLTFPPGQGGLPTLRLRLHLAVPTPDGARLSLAYQDNNYADRLGWREVVVDSADGVQLTRTSVPSQDISQGLTSYPTDMLQSPLAVSSAQVEAVLTGRAGGISAESPASSLAAAAPDANRFSPDRLANLINRTDWSPLTITLTALAAFGLGALHALTPGHGKTIVGAYLVGSRGAPRHALLLGLTTTITHTAGVFAFGLLILFASRWFLPRQILPWFGVASGGLVALIGFSMLLNAWQRHRQPAVAEAPGYHTHFGVGHTHTPVAAHGLGWRALLAMGVSGGLVPCPSALVLLLAAIALQRVGAGLILIVIFSLGLASVLTAIGLLFVYAGRWMERRSSAGLGRVAAFLPVVSALFITLAGVLITIRAMSGVGV